MPQDSNTSPPSVFRFACPHCQKILKARQEWAGKRGVCPNCKKNIQFPDYSPPAITSRTAQQLLKLVAHDDNITLDDPEADRMAMLLSQATCRDFLLAKKLLADRPLSARQWRRILNSAATREAMRLQIEQQLERLAEIPDDDSEPSALIAAAEIANPNAWTVMVRFLYYLRHGQCDKCQSDLTGLSCIYLTFPAFITARLIEGPRSESWQKIVHHHLGL